MFYMSGLWDRLSSASKEQQRFFNWSKICLENINIYKFTSEVLFYVIITSEIC